MLFCSYAPFSCSSLLASLAFAAGHQQNSPAPRKHSIQDQDQATGEGEQKPERHQPEARPGYVDKPGLPMERKYS